MSSPRSSRARGEVRSAKRVADTTEEEDFWWLKSAREEMAMRTAKMGRERDQRKEVSSTSAKG